MPLYALMGLPAPGVVFLPRAGGLSPSIPVGLVILIAYTLASWAAVILPNRKKRGERCDRKNSRPAPRLPGSSG